MGLGRWWKHWFSGVLSNPEGHRDRTGSAAQRGADGAVQGGATGEAGREELAGAFHSPGPRERTQPAQQPQRWPPAAAGTLTKSRRAESSESGTEPSSPTVSRCWTAQRPPRSRPGAHPCRCDPSSCSQRLIVSVLVSFSRYLQISSCSGQHQNACESQSSADPGRTGCDKGRPRPLPGGRERTGLQVGTSLASTASGRGLESVI